MYQEIENDWNNFYINLLFERATINNKWNILSSSPLISLNIIKKYPDKPWDYANIGKRPDLTLDFIENNIDKKWDWKILSSNNIITVNFIKKYSNKPWDFFIISQNEYLFSKLKDSNDIKIDIKSINTFSGFKKNTITTYHDENDYIIFNYLKDNFFKNRYHKYLTKEVYQELMMKIFHPKNIHKFKYIGFNDDDE